MMLSLLQTMAMRSAKFSIPANPFFEAFLDVQFWSIELFINKANTLKRMPRLSMPVISSISPKRSKSRAICPCASRAGAEKMF